MSKMARHDGDALSTALGIIIGVSVLAALYRGTEFVPRFDAWASPVVKFGPTTDIFRQVHDMRYTTGRVCFTLNITKIRDAVPLPYQFRVSTKYNLAGQGIDVYLAEKNNDRSPDQGYGRPHAAGETWGRRYCAELPGSVGDADTLTISGYAEHRRHPFWDTETPIPPFVINPAHDANST